MGLGALIMYDSGISFSNKGFVFAGQLINLYTQNLGSATDIDGFYKIQASTWLGTFDVAIDNITGTEAEGITVAGKAAGKTVSQLLPAGKIAEIKANVMKKIVKFKVEGKLADFIFLKK